MAIDWFTVCAQILNFLILVWLLRRFLYRPVLDAIDRREKRIAATLAEAGAMKEQASRERDALLARNNQFEEERASLFAKATEEAQAEGRRLAEEARNAVEALKAKQRRALARDAANLTAEVGRRARSEVLAIARKALAEMTDAGLEDRMIVRFIGKLATLEPSEIATMAIALGSGGEAVVRTAFELGGERRAAVRDAVERAFTSGIRLRFETAPEVIGGLELVAGGQKLAWTFSEYIKGLEKSVGEVLRNDTSAVAAAH